MGWVSARSSEDVNMASKQMSIVLLLCGLVSAVPVGAISQGDLSIQAGLSVSNNPLYDSVALVEFPFQLNRSEYEFYRPDSADDVWYARIFAQVNLINHNGYDIDSVNTYFSVRVAHADDTADAGIKLLNQLSLAVQPGVYTARLTVIDAVSKRTNSVFYDRVIVEPSPRRMAMGGGRLAHRIRHVDSTSPSVNNRMLKNGLEVLTNPVGLIDAGDSVLYVYAEIYNLSPADPPNDRYHIRYRVLDKSGQPVRELGTIKRVKPGSSAVIAQSFDIHDWRTGYHSLELTAVDPATEQADTLTLPFRIMSSSEVATVVAARNPMNDPYDSLSLKQKMDLVRYELTPDQRLTLESLGDIGRENYLRQYWRDRDQTPGTPANEVRLELIRRFQYANERFSTNEAHDNGWLSDRGRIYMRYGEPTQKTTRYAPVVGYPYLIWHYRNIKEGLAFVFEDQYGYGDFLLVHSNADGEIFNSVWDSRLKEGAFIEINHDI